MGWGLRTSPLVLEFSLVGLASVVHLRSFSLSSNLHLSGQNGYRVMVVFSMILFLSFPDSLNDHVILSVVLALVLLHTCNIKWMDSGIGAAS